MDDELLSNYKMWTRAATSILIQQYQANECMWMTTSPFYRNKQKRSEALINIAMAVAKLRPQTTTEDVKNKINGIRTQYVSEINKLIVASNRNETYEPTLWCFDMLSFLKPFTQPKQKSVNRDWYRTYMPKQVRPEFAIPPKLQSRPQLQESSQPSSQPNTILIKEETDNDIEIIEEEDTLNTDDDYSSHSSYHIDQEDKPFREEREDTNQRSSSSAKEATPPPPNIDSGFEDQEQTNRVRKLFSPSGISAEITLVPKKNMVKRKVEETNDVVIFEEKRKKVEAETNTDNSGDETENRINIFGRFVMSQMKIIKDKVLLLKLEHTIQNAIIDAQLKQIEIDESVKTEKGNQK